MSAHDTAALEADWTARADDLERRLRDGSQDVTAAEHRLRELLADQATSETLQ